MFAQLSAFYARLLDQSRCDFASRLARFGLLSLSLLLILLTSSCGGSGGAGVASSSGGSGGAPSSASLPGSAYAYLASVYDESVSTRDVYTDSDSAANLFPARGRFNSPGGEAGLPPMDESYPDDRRGADGINSIHAQFIANGSNYGGWYFLNGYLEGSQTVPQLNWGDHPNAGLDLRGADRLTFWARGKSGGERVEFFALGVGWDPATGRKNMPHPDSSPKATLGFVTLTDHWKEYTISLSDKDLSYVLGGFGFGTSAQENGNRSIDFFVDDIQYHLAHPNDLHLPLSFKTIRSNNDFDKVARNVAFVYDADVMLLSALANEDKMRARLLADTLVYAIQHDRFYNDGGIRTAYQADGSIKLFPGWTPNGKADTARMSGWYDATREHWFEDRLQVGRNTGNVAWTAIALISAYQVLGDAKYLDAAKGLSNWVEQNCRDSRGAGGYTAGYDGWEPSPTQLTYKATEHNIDMYCINSRLFAVTKDTVYQVRAAYARQFVEALWDDSAGVFYTGTMPDGVTINKENVPVDIQAWALLSLRDATAKYRRGLDYAEAHHRVEGGFDFNQDQDGVWPEGSSQVAAAYSLLGQHDKAQAIIAYLQSHLQDKSGGVWAASKDGITTGFLLPDGKPWLYFHRLHVGGTSWLALAQKAEEKNLNPFYIGDSTTP